MRLRLAVPETAAQTALPAASAPVPAPAVVAEMTTPGMSVTVEPVIAAPAARPALMLLWEYNPETVTITTDAVSVLSPVWLALGVENGELTVNRRRASRAYVTAAQARGCRVWPTVQLLQAAPAHVLLNSEPLMAAAVAAVVAFAETCAADGIVLDAENHPVEDAAALTAFTARLGAHLRARGIPLAVCITRRWSTAADRYDRAGLARAADFVILMAYDQHWSMSPQNGPVASLEWVEQGVVQTLDEVPADKLLLAVPFYAYDWEHLRDPASPDTAPRHIRPAAFRALTLDETWDLACDSVTATRRGDTLAVQTWQQPPVWLDTESVMYMSFTDVQGGEHEIWFENVRSLDLKLALVGKYGLAGAAAWQGRFADRDGQCWQPVRTRLFAPR